MPTRLLTLLRRYGRPALLGVALVLAMLTTVSAQPDAGGCLDGQETNGRSCLALCPVSCPDDAGGDPRPATPDHHDDGHCHCPGAMTMVTLPDQAVMPVSGICAATRRFAVATAIPDGRSYPPDPPPIRVN